MGDDLFIFGIQNETYQVETILPFRLFLSNHPSRLSSTEMASWCSCMVSPTHSWGAERHVIIVHHRARHVSLPVPTRKLVGVPGSIEKLLCCQRCAILWLQFVTSSSQLTQKTKAFPTQKIYKMSSRKEPCWPYKKKHLTTPGRSTPPPRARLDGRSTWDWWCL